MNPATGKRSLVFKITQAFSGIPLDLPCNQCIGCRLEKARQWALRIVHEKRLHRESDFLTLTYEDKNLPPGGSLVVRDLQLFMKRLRKNLGPVRFYACGEYGELTSRPHYHVLLLNASFHDRKFYKRSRDHDLYNSAALSKLWTVGDHYIGDVTFESAAYCARYVTKKITGPPAEAHYAGRLPEFATMSLKPAIGLGWFDKYKDEAYKADSAISNGKQVALPRYYDKKLEALEPARLIKIKRARKRKAARNKSDNTPARRRVKERFTELMMQHHQREK